MKEVFSLVLIVAMFNGCSIVKPRVIVPTMAKIENKKLSWTDMVVDGQQVHVLDRYEWEDIQIELINRRITGNLCIDILNNVSKE